MTSVMAAKPTRIFIIAAEVSSDQHAAAMIRALKKQRPALEIFGIGGDELAAEGMEILVHLRNMAFMGIIEVVKHLPHIFRVKKLLLQAITDRRPDLVILLDYPGFNLRIAEDIHRRGLPIIYYISPQIWAWGQHRVHKIKKLISRVLVLFPFERDFYARFGVDVRYTGHPLLDKHKSVLSVPARPFNQNKPRLGLLPGSRHQEVSRLLPDMISVARQLLASGEISSAEVVRVPHLADAEYEPARNCHPQLTISEGPIEKCLPDYDAVIVASGTATLEVALYLVPMVIVYKVNGLTFRLGRYLVRIPHVGLANIVAESEVARELLQDDCTPENLLIEVRKLLQPENHRAVQEKLKLIRLKLGQPGAAENAANEVNLFLQSR